MQIEAFVESDNGICDEGLCDYQPIDPIRQSMNLKMSEFKEYDPCEFIEDIESGHFS
jgi:hypothetical protein